MISNASLHRILSLFVAILVVFGSCGYVLIEGWPFMDSLFMTLITLSTVGYGEVQELSHSGRIYTSGLIGISIVLMTCWTSALTSVLVSGEVSGRFRKAKEQRMISALSNHVVICGGGPMAMAVIHQLSSTSTAVVVVTDCEDEFDQIQRVAPDVLIVKEDPKSELALADANAFAAGYLVAATESDYDNLLITITGKSLGTSIRVISCSQSTELASRMMKVGADDVICPLILGGEHAAGLITQHQEAVLA